MKHNAEEKILPVVAPTVTSWPWHAALMSILETRAETKPWIYSNYIKLVGGMNYEAISFDFLPNVFDYAICPWIKAQLFSRNYIMENHGDIKEFFINAIDSGYYIFTIVNTQYAYSDISGKIHDRFPHEMLIYGYNKGKNLFYVGDFGFHEKYSFENVNMESIINGYKDIHIEEDYIAHRREGIFLLQINETTKYSFDPILTKYYLQGYIEGGGLDVTSRVSITDNSSLVHSSNIERFGIKTYELLDYYFSLVAEGKQCLDIRISHVLYDHKTLMFERFSFMHKMGYISDTEIIEKARVIRETALKLRNLMLKAINSNNKDINIVKRLQEGYKELCIMERELYPQVVQQMT